MKISLSWITGVAALLNAALIPTVFLLAVDPTSLWKLMDVSLPFLRHERCYNFSFQYSAREIVE